MSTQIVVLSRYCFRKFHGLLQNMAPRYFKNPYPDSNAAVDIPEEKIADLLKGYVSNILKHTYEEKDSRGELYTGSSGIAFAFYRLSQSRVSHLFPDALKHAQHYIDRAKARAAKYQNRESETVSFLCGNAGIWAVSAAISKAQNSQSLQEDLQLFSAGFKACQKLHLNDYGSDEVLFGRAGFLGGVYWLNQTLGPTFSREQVLKVCEAMFESGAQYSRRKQLRVPLMYECYGEQYLGAAHGISAILHMFLEAPIDEDKLKVVKESVDHFLALQDREGNFPAALGDKDSSRLVHWCHGAPGAVYVLAKAYLVFKETKYLEACRRCADLVWEKGLLLKGPGICHGVAGNGYVFLLMFRLTNEPQYFNRAVKFFEFLQHEDFLTHARTPDRPFSLYEGISGTVCYLLDLLEPQKAAFPFMDVLETKV